MNFSDYAKDIKLSFIDREQVTGEVTSGDSALKLILGQLYNTDSSNVALIGAFLYYEFFNDDEIPEDISYDFNYIDIVQMLANLDESLYDEVYFDIVELLKNQSINVDYGFDSIDVVTNEGVSGVMKHSSKNHKKRKFFTLSKADLVATAAKRRVERAKNKAQTRRYYQANKAKMKRYQASRNKAIKQKTHFVKMRAKA